MDVAQLHDHLRKQQEAGGWVGQNLKKRRGNQYKVGKYNLP